MLDAERKFVETEIVKELASWAAIKGQFCAERYPGTPLLDTHVVLEIDRIAITWNDREKLMDDLVKVFQKYMI